MRSPLLSSCAGFFVLASALACGGGGGGGTPPTPAPTPTIVISPANPSVAAGATLALTASLANGTVKNGFGWSVPSGQGLISPASFGSNQATYYAPANTGSATVTTTSLDYLATTTQVIVTITAAPTVDVNRYPSNRSYSFFPYSAAPSEGFWFCAADLTTGTGNYYAKVSAGGVYTWFPMPQISGLAQSQLPDALAAGGPNNSLLYILAEGDGPSLKVHRINPATGAVDATTSTGINTLELNFGLGVDSGGNIWTNGKLSDLSPVFVRIPVGGGTTSNFPIPGTPIFLANPLVDANGAWWLDSVNGGRLLNVGTSGIVTPYTGALQNGVIGPAAGSNGSLWIGYEDTLAQFIPGTGFKPVIHLASGLLSFNAKSLLGATSEGRFWFGCTNVSNGSPYLGVINTDGTQAYFKMVLNPAGVAVSLDRGSISADGKFYFLDRTNKAVLVLTHP